MYTVDNFINGKSDSTSSKSSKIINPSYGEDIGEVLYASKESANTAINAASEAFKTWSKTGMSYRAELILKFRQGVLVIRTFFFDYVSINTRYQRLISSRCRLCIIW